MTQVFSRGRIEALAAVALLVAACASGAPATTHPAPAVPTTVPSVAAPPAPSATPAGHVLHYVAFGDSWPGAGHCGGCKTFADLWIRGLEAATGATIEYTNFTGAHEPGAHGGGDSGTLLKVLRTDAQVRAGAAGADIILIATGGNELRLVAGPLLGGTCGGTDGADCIRALGKTWTTNFDAILSEIETLRGGKPTVIRLVSGANPFVSDPSMTDGLPKGFATGNGALIFQLLNDAMCSAAAKHHAVCVDVRPILNGPSMVAPVDENSAESFQKVTDALNASGVAELESQ